MALPMGLTAAALAWLAWRVGGAEFALAAAGVALLFGGALIAMRTLTFRKPAVATAAVLAIAAAALLPRLAQSPGAQPTALDAAAFSAKALADARADGPVFVYFTADWCLTCKVNERVAIERDATRDAFQAAGVTALRGDWTRPDPAIAAFLAEHGAAGVPLYLWYEPGAAPEKLPQVLTPDALLSRAARPRGTLAAGGG